MLRVQNDILQELDNGKSVFLVLLDLSAAFDIVSHQFLLKRLSKQFESDWKCQWTGYSRT